MYDYHLHSSFSFDGSDSPMLFAREAAKNGIKEICFCEHIEIGHNYPISWDGKPKTDEYFSALNRISQEDVTIKAGYEAGITPQNLQETYDFVSKTPCDFVIASCHFIEGKDPYDESESLFSGRDVKEVMQSYLQDILYCVKNFGCFNVIGHIGYAGKYSAPPHLITYEKYGDLIDEILVCAISKEKGIEINTSAWDIFGCGIPATDIIKRFFELGGEIITTGSDGHKAEKTGSRIKNAIEIIKNCGGKYICTFDKMQPIYHVL